MGNKYAGKGKLERGGRKWLLWWSAGTERLICQECRKCSESLDENGICDECLKRRKKKAEAHAVELLAACQAVHDDWDHNLTDAVAKVNAALEKFKTE